MVLNKKGSVTIYGLMLAMVIVILALALAYPVREAVDDARGTDGINCANPTISNFDKAACVSSDISIFWFIGGLIFLAGAIMVAKLVFS